MGSGLEGDGLLGRTSRLTRESYTAREAPQKRARGLLTVYEIGVFSTFSDRFIDWARQRMVQGPRERKGSRSQEDHATRVVLCCLGWECLDWIKEIVKRWKVGKWKKKGKRGSEPARRAGTGGKKV